MTTLGAVHVRLLVADLEACVRFYRDTLGLEQTLDAGVYAEFRAGDVVFGVYRRDLMAEVVGSAGKPALEESQDSVALIFAVDDVDAAYRQLQAQGVTFVVGPTDREAWVLRTAHFRDPDGNLIEINAPLHG